MARALTRRCILKIAKIEISHNTYEERFRPCLQVVASGVAMSAEADTLPVCSIVE